MPTLSPVFTGLVLIRPQTVFPTLGAGAPQAFHPSFQKSPIGLLPETGQSTLHPLDRAFGLRDQLYEHSRLTNHPEPMAHAETGLVTGARVAFASAGGPSEPPSDHPAASRPYSKTVLIVLEPSIRGENDGGQLEFYSEVIGEVSAALGGSLLKHVGHDTVVRVADHDDNIKVASEIVHALRTALGERGVDLRHILSETSATLDPGLHPQIRYVVGFAQRGALAQALGAKNFLKTVEDCDTLLRILRSPVEFPRPDAGHLGLMERVKAHRRYLLERPADVEVRRVQFVDRVLELCEELIRRPVSRDDWITPDPIRLIGELKLMDGPYDEEEIQRRFVESFPALSALIRLAINDYCRASDLEIHALQVALAVKGHPALHEYDLIRLVGLRFTEETERERLRRWREAILGGNQGGNL